MRTFLVALVAIVVLGVIVFFVMNRPATPSPETATSTPTSTAVTPTPGSPNPNPSPTPTPPAQPSAPAVQTNNQATVSNSTAVVTGSVTPNGAPTSYWYEYGRTTSLGSRTTSQSIGSGYRAIAAPGYITGLAANTHYYFRLSARNSLGTVNGTMYDFTTNSTPPPRANAPTVTTNAATDVTRSTANLHGRVNPNGSDTSYWFEYGTNANLGNTTALQSAGSGTSAQSVAVSLSGLEPATKYFVRMNAQNQFGTVNGAIVTFVTSGPPAPSKPSATTLSATSVTDSSATFNGRVNPNGSDTTYWFEYSQDNLLGNIIGSTTPQQSAGSGTTAQTVAANVTGLASGTKYYVRVVAQNTEGTTRGDTMTFTTK